LVRHPYGDDTVTAWTEALSDVDEHDAVRAVSALAAAGTASIAIPEIRQWLRSERAGHRRAAESTTTADPIRFASMRPDAIAARRHWWGGKRDEHYPGCLCGRHFSANEDLHDERNF